MADISEAELKTILKNQLGDTIKYGDDTFKRENLDLDNAYRQKPYGNEEPNHSQVVASDVYDTVESDMPALARIFLGAKDVIKFMPNNASDVKEAEQKTKYANFLIRGQSNSFKTLHDLLKQPGKALCSVAHFGIEDTEEAEYHYSEGLTEDGVTMALRDLDGEDVKRVEIARRSEQDGGKYSIYFRVVKSRRKIFIQGIPSEDFIISRRAESKDKAMIVGHECKKTKGELIAEGYDKEAVQKLKPNRDERGTELKRNRFEDTGGWDEASGYHWTNEEVTLQNLYPLVDYDNDGIPERRWVLKCGETILENEPYGYVPYALFSQILEPYSAIGHSRGEQAARYQEKNTALERGIFDNIYEVNRPRIAYDDSSGGIDGGSVGIDQLLYHEIGGVVPTDGDPHTKLMNLEVLYVGDKALQVVQWLDSQKSVTLGNQMASQGLNSDNLYKETATRFEGVKESQEAKLELVARVYAETGFRELYEGVIWVAQHYQDDVAEFMVLGEQLIVDPRQWRYQHYCASQVGLGAGDSAEAIANMGAIVQQQWQNIQAGSPLADWTKLYNAYDKLMKMMGEADTTAYWNNPEVPEEVLYAQNMQLQGMVQQMGAMMQNPLAQAEQVKQQGALMAQKMRTDADMQKHVMKLMQEDEHFAAKVAQSMTEMSMKYDFNLSPVDKANIFATLAKAQKDIAETDAQNIESSDVVREFMR